jgi:hypothetical protein
VAELNHAAALPLAPVVPSDKATNVTNASRSASSTGPPDLNSNAPPNGLDFDRSCAGPQIFTEPDDMC